MTCIVDFAFQESSVNMALFIYFSWFSLTLKSFKKIGQPSCGERSTLLLFILS